MPHCYIMVGFPGVGKSTYIKNNLPNMVVNSSDDILEEFAKSLSKTYDEAFNSHGQIATKMFFENIRNSVSKKESFIVDRTNLTKKSRRRITSNLTKDYKVTILVFEISENLHSEYLNSRKSKYIPHSVIENFKNIFEFPTLDEGFDEIIHIKKE
jgi:predicted kinase